MHLPRRWRISKPSLTSFISSLDNPIFSPHFFTVAIVGARKLLLIYFWHFFSKTQKFSEDKSVNIVQGYKYLIYFFVSYSQSSEKNYSLLTFKKEQDTHKTEKEKGIII